MKSVNKNGIRRMCNPCRGRALAAWLPCAYGMVTFAWKGSPQSSELQSSYSTFKIVNKMGLEECILRMCNPRKGRAGYWLQGCLVHMECSHLHGKVLWNIHVKARNYKAALSNFKLLYSRKV